MTWIAQTDTQSERARGKNHQAYLWRYSRPGGAVVFDFRMGRERERLGRRNLPAIKNPDPRLSWLDLARLGQLPDQSDRRAHACSLAGSQLITPNPVE